LDYLFGDSPVAAPPSVFYFGLSTVDANVNGVYTEPSLANYSRVAYLNNNSYWNSSTANSGNPVYNLSTITFPTSTSSWGTIKSIFMADASSGGNIVWYQQLTTPLYIQPNMPITWPSTTGFVISML
jgi:hypothetical protein